MKGYLTFIILLLAQFSIAQNNSGIFLSCQDYKSNKLSYSFNCDSSSGKIRLNDFLAKSCVDVFYDGNKITLCKDSIYGYRDCNQNDFRFYKVHDKAYKIEENKTIIIYSSYTSVLSSSGKRMELVSQYFFSTGLNSVILPLTIINLKKSFPDNLKFHDKLDEEFQSESDISTYDDAHKMYKVNYLLSQSKIN